MEIPRGFYVEEGFAVLAGPYDRTNEREERMLETAVAHLKDDPSIEWRLTGEVYATMIERKGMVLNLRLVE